MRISKPSTRRCSGKLKWRRASAALVTCMTSLNRVCCVVIIAAIPYPLLSQAWVSPRDQGTVSMLYQYGFDRYHALSQGENVDRGHMTLQAVMLDVDYSLTERLAVRVAAPFIEGRYAGKEPHVLIRGQKD